MKTIITQTKNMKNDKQAHCNCADFNVIVI